MQIHFLFNTQKHLALRWMWRSGRKSFILSWWPTAIYFRCTQQAVVMMCLWCLDMHTLINTRTRKDWCDRWLQETWPVGRGFRRAAGGSCSCVGDVPIDRSSVSVSSALSSVKTNTTRSFIYLFKINISHLLVASPTHQACILYIQLCEFVWHFLYNFRYLQLLIIV